MYQYIYQQEKLKHTLYEIWLMIIIKHHACYVGKWNASDLRYVKYLVTLVRDAR